MDTAILEMGGGKAFVPEFKMSEFPGHLWAPRSCCGALMGTSQRTLVSNSGHWWSDLIACGCCGSAKNSLERVTGIEPEWPAWKGGKVGTLPP